MNSADATYFDTIIVGAGAAGLMCAAIAGQRGKRVYVLDHAEKAGKKILISGGGRCNFTNRFTSAEHFLSQNPHFCKSALARFTPADFLAMIEQYNIAWHERKHGQLFCAHSARDIVNMLLSECRKGGVMLKLATHITQIDKNPHGFRLHTSRGHLQGKQLVIASGGLSIPKMGATPFGLKVAEQFGLKIVPPHAGLVPLTFTGKVKDRLSSLAGISLDICVRYGRQHFREAMLFTHRGLSGPAILQISSYWEPGTCIDIDLLPDTDIDQALHTWQRKRPQARLVTSLAELLPKRLAHALCEQMRHNEPLETLSDQQIEHITYQLHHWKLKPNGSEGYRTAEVTVGGVDTAELSSASMEARRVPGLYFIGEVIDVTGHLGGFNFQWAWASAHACASAL